MLWAKPCHYEMPISATCGWCGSGTGGCTCQEGPPGLAVLCSPFPDPWETSMGCKMWCVPWASGGPPLIYTCAGGSSSNADLGDSERWGHICFGRWWYLGMASDGRGLWHEADSSGQQDKGTSVSGRKEQLEHVLTWKLGRRSGGGCSSRCLSASCP